MEDIIYYQMWPKKEQSDNEVAALRYRSFGKAIPPRFLRYVDVETNDSLFVNSLKTLPLDYGGWLRDMMGHYMKRKSHSAAFIDNDKFRREWMEHTIKLTEKDYPVIAKWCKEYK